MKKCIYETPHNEIKCAVCFVKESNFNEKKSPKFSHLLTVRAKVAETTPLTVSLTVKYMFFYA